MIFQHSTTLLTLLSLTAAYTCITPRHLLPTPRDCHTLIDVFEILSIDPRYNAPLLWSRQANDTLTSRRLPKSYRLISHVPNTCAIHIDAVPNNLNAEDTFALSSVGNMAEILVEQCLVRRMNVGWGFPGTKANIQVIVVRMDGYWLGRGPGWVKKVGQRLPEIGEIVGKRGDGTKDGVLIY